MALEVLYTPEDFHILATSSTVEKRTRVLKHGDTFAVFNAVGDVGTPGIGDEGIYHRDTRFLSRMRLRLADAQPVLLSSNVRADNAMMTADLTNTDIRVGDIVAAPHGMLHLFRSKVLWEGACYERLRLHNYGQLPIMLPVRFEFDCDFADIFEVRGMERGGRGERLAPRVLDGSIEFVYEGLDGRYRTTRLTFDPEPTDVEERSARFEARLPSQGTAFFGVTVQCEVDDEHYEHVRIGFDAAAKAASRFMKAGGAEEATIRTGNDLFDRWIERSFADLWMLRTNTSHGPYVYAGVPWFSTVFGRDGIITALETLWCDPAIARGVLTYLATNQADSVSPENDAQPGKILHETREGEMATVGDVPFRRYYGSIDSTPLFIVLAAEYYDRTADRPLLEFLWPNIVRALEWIDRYGDLDGDGFVEYAVKAEGGLVHQGWKDSTDPIFHADGSLAEPPIALCEVQGYVYAAKRGAARLARMMGHDEVAARLDDEASELRERFDATFWSERIGTYVLALDGEKRPCAVRSSNAGHCLFSGIASQEQAATIVRTLMDPRSFSGWGVRTIATTESRYNPMSYHDGTIWPHDNALIAAGFARYGYKAEAGAVLGALFDASVAFDLHRLPELFCGFERREYEEPVRYPVSCAPQAWAAGAVLMLLQSCLGIEINWPERRVAFVDPWLPEYLPGIEIRDLVLGEDSVDLRVVRRDGEIAVDVMRPAEGVRVEVVRGQGRPGGVAERRGAVRR